MHSWDAFAHPCVPQTTPLRLSRDRCVRCRQSAHSTGPVAELAEQRADAGAEEPGPAADL